MENIGQMKHIKLVRASLLKSCNTLNPLITLTMPSSTDNLGEAVQSDGTLKDALKIVWSYDADDSIPFPAGSTSASLPVSASWHAPATVVASVRRTTHVIQPCRRYLEDDDVESRSAPTCKTSGAKRKAANTLINPQATCM